MSERSERNLLFVVFALQLDLLAGDQLAAATGLWLRDQEQSIESILLAQRLLDQESVDLVQRLIEKHIEKHGGSAADSLRIVSEKTDASQSNLNKVATDAELVGSSSILGDTSEQSLSARFNLQSDASVEESLRALAGSVESFREPATLSPSEFLAKFPGDRGAVQQLLSQSQTEQGNPTADDNSPQIHRSPSEALPPDVPPEAMEHTLLSTPGRASGRASDTELQSELRPTETLDAGMETDIARFSRLREHARGGLGTVCVALDLQFNREVALKEIRAEYSTSEESQTRFFQEAFINGGLEHPGIVPVYALGRNHQGQPYYAMRYIRGESLKRTLKRIHPDGNPKQWSRDARAELNRLLGHFTDACNAIAYAHSRGVIHRDIKPSNTMVGRYGETLVVDWGLAKPIGRDGSTENATDEMTLLPSGSGSGKFETRIGQALGTPQYMSPEQARGNVTKIGVASDIFNLGAMLYEILTGRAPYSGEQLESIVNCDFKPPRLVNPSIDPALTAICQKAMSRKIEDRYRTADELTRDIESWQADLPIAAYTESAAERARRWMRKHQSIVTGALAAMLVFAVSLGVLAGVMQSNNTRLTQANKAQRIAQVDAENSAAEAVEQSQLALDALNSIVFNVQTRLKGVPAAAAARRELLKSALEGLERVSARIQLREGIAKNQSQALIELGEVFVSIGDEAELGTALEEGSELIARAVAIREQLHRDAPEDSAISRDLCVALSLLGDACERLGHTSQAAEHYRRMMQLSREAVERDAGPDNLAVLAEAQTRLGDMERRIGTGPDALEQYAQATELYRRLVQDGGSKDRVKYTRDLADAYNREGAMQMRLGDLRAAETAYQLALDLIDGLPEDAASKNIDERMRSRFLVNLGKVKLEARREAEALKDYEAAFKLRSAAAALDPANAAVQAELANVYTRLGEVHLRAREFALSIEDYEAAREIYYNLSEADPMSLEWKLELSQAYSNLAGAYFSADDLEASLNFHQRAREVSEILVARDPSDSAKLRDLAVTWLNIGMAYNRLAENDRAISAHERSAEACERLFALDPDDARVQDYAIANYWYLSDLYQVDDDRQKVLESFRRAIRFSDKVLERSPAKAGVRASRAEIRGYLALYQNDFTTAAEQAAEFARADPSNTDNWYNAACLYCLVIEAATETEAEDSLQSALEQWTQSALAALRTAVDDGYDDFENLRDDQDLSVLHAYPEFAALFPTDTPFSQPE